jgi:hypothetical protein
MSAIRRLRQILYQLDLWQAETQVNMDICTSSEKKSLLVYQEKQEFGARSKDPEIWPVSGFPKLFGSTGKLFETLELTPRCYQPPSVMYDTSDEYRWLSMCEPSSWRAHSHLDDAYENRWNALIGKTTFTKEQLARMYKLLFRMPFLQERWYLGLLMVHPSANQQRFVNTTGVLMHSLIGHRVCRDVFNLILLFAYEPSAHH